MAEIETRAGGILTMLLVTEKLCGADVVARGIEAMPSPARENIRAKRLLPSTWLPISVYRALLHGLALPDEKMRELARASATHDVNTIYKLVFKMMTPEMLAKQTPRLFGIYYRGADIRVLDSSKTHCRIDYRACHGFDRTVWRDYMHGAEVILELCGAKNVQTVVDEGGEADTMVASARWE